MAQKGTVPIAAALTMPSISGSIAKIEFGPAQEPWVATVRTKIPLPEYIRITWESGTQLQMAPYQLADGAARDVLCGIDASTGAEATVVLKIQKWSWHEKSNGHEYNLATTVLKFCTPEFYGVHRVKRNVRLIGFSR